MQQETEPREPAALRLPYRDRVQAARAVAAELARYSGDRSVLVLGLARGGAQVGYEIARGLGAPLDLLVVHKLRVPGREELPAAAIAADGVVVLAPGTAELVARDALERRIRRERRALEQRERFFRGDRPRPVLDGRTVILADDGAATGLTMRAAVQLARARNAAKVVVALPVAPIEAVALLRAEADEVACPVTPAPFSAVGAWYSDFRQVDDAAVRELFDRGGSADGHDSHSNGRSVAISSRGGEVRGVLTIPKNSPAIVLAGQGDEHCAAVFNQLGLATLVLDLAAADDRPSAVERATGRLLDAIAWANDRSESANMPVGLFGAGVAAGAALRAAAQRPDAVRAVVAWSGRPDLAGPTSLPRVLAPTLLVVGSRDPRARALNRDAAARLTCPHRLELVLGATHGFREPGALDELARLAGDWFRHYL